MKKHLLLVIPILAALTLAGCKKDVTPVNSTLSIKTLNITSGDTIAVPGNVTFNVSIADDNYALSTLEISAALEDGTVIASESIRTTGNSVDLTDQILEIPFCAGMDAGASLGVTFKAINVDGESVVQSEILSIKRPSLPSELYMTVGDRVYTMAQDDTDSYLYSTKETDGFESAVTATISTASDLSEASYIWGASGTTNLGKICSISDSGIEISYPSVMVDNYTFNALTFEVKAVGQEFDVSVNGKALTPSSGLLYANVSFTKDAQFEITGIADMDSAWNRDFFSYEDGKFTFLRESGSYDVYYSPKYNYIWVVNMDAVAPECLWVIGHGFTCATEWNTDYASGGWSNTDVLQMGYAVRIADERYQCSMYLNNEHEWGTFEFEVYSDRQWNKTNGFCGISLSGDTRGVKLNGAADGKPGLTSDSGFHPGYYTIVFDNATGDINLTRISPWQDTGGTSMSINGTTLESDP
ncbi:MAG: hypothetical protein LKJ93_08450, partial [Bacteroidales bacterium]|nr:hypothetical protein [Bacteroidales bacterium]